MNAVMNYVFGSWRDAESLTVDAAREVIRLARERLAERRAPSWSETCDVIGRLRPEWSPGGPSREAFLSDRPWEPLRLSRQMVEQGLDGFARRLDSDGAAGRIRVQLGGGGCLDDFADRAGRRVRAIPLGVVLHIVSGSVFVGPVESLLAGVLTGNVNVVKRPSEGGDFLDHFLRSVERTSEKVARRVAILSWRGGDAPVDRELAGEADGIVVAAGPETVRAYRSAASPTTELIEFGPRLSIAVLTRTGVRSLNARALALDVAVWDQLACTSAQCVYVEGRAEALTVAALLADALDVLQGEIPSGRAALDERIEIARFRDAARFRESCGMAKIYAGRSGWTVVFQDDQTLVGTPLRRTVVIKPFAGIDALAQVLEPGRGYLQTAGLAAGSDEGDAYEHMLCSVGIRRICAVGSMNDPAPEGIHDGTMELTRFVRWVEREATC